MEIADRWSPGWPAELIRSAGFTLSRASIGDLAELVEAVNSSLEELRPWMPWAQVPATEESIAGFLERADHGWETGGEFQFAIRGRRGELQEALLGFSGLHDRVGAGVLEIGYWVRSDCTGRGVATAAASGLTIAALDLDSVSRVEIHCDATNLPSAAIPRKLGFRLERTETRPPRTPGEKDREMIWVRSLETR